MRAFKRKLLNVLTKCQADVESGKEKFLENGDVKDIGETLILIEIEMKGLVEEVKDLPIENEDRILAMRTVQTIWESGLGLTDLIVPEQEASLKESLGITEDCGDDHCGGCHCG